MTLKNAFILLILIVFFMGCEGKTDIVDPEEPEDTLSAKVEILDWEQEFKTIHYEIKGVLYLKKYEEIKLHYKLENTGNVDIGPNILDGHYLDSYIISFKAISKTAPTTSPYVLDSIWWYPSGSESLGVAVGDIIIDSFEMKNCLEGIYMPVTSLECIYMTVFKGFEESNVSLGN